jgi:hypothetical protein
MDLDPHPHLVFRLDLDPDPHTTDADPKHCFPGRKTNTTIGFGHSAMHKVVLGPARVIRQLKNGAHSLRGGLSSSTVIT